MDRVPSLPNVGELVGRARSKLPGASRGGSSRRLEWTAAPLHSFRFELWHPRWPPFYATAFFLPRIDLEIENQGETLPTGTTIGLYVGAYDGPIGEVTPAQIPWVDTEHQPIEGDWKRGETKRLRLRVRGRNLPHEGTYVLKLFVTKSVPMGTPREEAMLVIEEANVPEATREALLRADEEFWAKVGIDPDQPQPHARRGEGLLTIHVIDYFRVEPLSNVLSFGLVIGTLLIALATLGLVIVTLILA